jgi:phage terminase Nu1 subunit (DNA packaging protein)
VSIDELVLAANQLNERDLEQFLSRVLLLKAKRQAPILSGVETELLLKINQGIPADLQQQYRALKAKQDDETLTDVEYQLLLELRSNFKSGLLRQSW